MGLQIRRGTDSERLTITPAAGEPIWTVDTLKLYIGDGSTVGGVLASPDQAIGIMDSPEFYNITISNQATVGSLLFASDTSTVITSRADLIGPTGYSGSQGYTGSVGSTGYAGSKGDLGYTGSAGSNGSTGYTGSKGDVGSQGSQGYTGSTGAGYTGSQGDTGYTGSQGAPGQSSNYYPYKAKTGTTSGDPGSGYLIWNNATQRSATQINLSHLDVDNNDIDVFLALLNSGDSLIVQDRNDSNNYQLWTISSAVTVFDNQYVEVPVTLSSSTGTGYSGFANNHDLLFIVQNAGVQGPIGYTGSKGDVGYTGSAGSYDQTLNTTDVVNFKGVKATQVMSAGGYPLDSNGQALLFSANTQSSSLVVSNYGGGLRPDILIRGWGQGRPGTVTTATNAAPGIMFQSARGSTSTPYAPQANDTLMAIQAGGYDGTRWSGDANLVPFQMVVLATETMIGNATTVTNAGTRFFIRSQPTGIQMDATSRQVFLSQTWTAGSTSAPPTSNILFGTAFNDAPTLTHSNGVNTFTGYGSTFINYINAKNIIFGVPGEDTTADNTTLTATNYLMFASGRRSGASGRRNIVSSGDSLGNLYFYGQTTNNATSIGNIGGSVVFKTLETWSGSARGTQAVISTVNSGTNTLSTRLSLDNNNAVLNASTIGLQGSQIVTGNGSATPRIQGQVGLDLSAANTGQGSEINLGLNGTITVTSSGTTMAIFRNAAIELLTASTKVGNTTAQAVLTSNGNQNLKLRTDNDDTNINLTTGTSIDVKGHVIPISDSVYDLGSSTKKWRSLYVSTSTIYIDDQAVSVSNGQLTINGSTQIGPTGYTGSQGNIGYTGSVGATGSTGATGSQGAIGYTGSQGPGITLSTASGTQSLSTSSGLLASITDNAGKLAYFNTTLNDWRYIDGDGDVFVPTYSIQYLVVAGGGASDQGGGGAGGYSTGTVSVTGGTSYTITVGAGGTAAAGGTANGGNGNNSSISSLSTSTGGGGGAWSTNTPGSGGSGGGAGQTGSGTYAGGTGTAGQGNNGGSNGGFNTPRYPGGGGGGAGAVGQNAQSGSQAGNGGIGKQWFDGNYYAGGGGGGNNTTGGTTTGGNGGGGAGGYGNNGGPPTAGTANTGGGGGGDGGTGYAGGSGVVIIRYSGSQVGSGGTVSSAGGYTYHTFTGSGTFVS